MDLIRDGTEWIAIRFLVLCFPPCFLAPFVRCAVKCELLFSFNKAFVSFDQRSSFYTPEEKQIRNTQ